MLPVDLTDRSETRRLFAELNPSAVVHCAAATDVDWCEEHPREAERINATVPSAIAEITAHSGARFLYISTDSVFDGAGANYAETDCPATVNVYARTKLRGEAEVLEKYPAASIARVNLYGWNAQNKFSLAEWVLKHLAAGEVVPGFTDAIFCPILANDLAEVLFNLLDQKLCGLYHVVGSEAVSKYEFARQVALRFGFDPMRVVPMRMAEAGMRARRPLNTSLNTRKISGALGRSMPNVAAGIRRLAELRESGYVDRIKGRLTGMSAGAQAGVQ